MIKSKFSTEKHQEAFVKSYFRKYIVFYILLSVTILSCEKDSSPFDSSSVNLIVEEVGVTEVWLKMEIENPKPGYEITVKRDTVTLYYSSVTAPETHLYDEQLLPRKEYIYHANLTVDGQTQTDKSQLTTMDTTSHNYTWVFFTFGSQAPSKLSDVIIINENDIWAVGEIYTEDTYTYDSLGNWIAPYNAVHWNGSDWQLKRILYKGGFWTIEAIYAFNENDIWFEPFVHWD